MMDRGFPSLFHLSVALCIISSSQSWGGKKDRVLLSDVQSLTLHRDKMTTARRTRAIPQLSCIGGSAGCKAFIPQVVQCYNRGSDGMDVQWECKTDVSHDFRFGRIEVVCEGYDNPDDPTILKGSCGLEYSIELTDEGRTHRKEFSGDYTSSKEQGHVKNPWYINWIFLGLVGVFVYFLYKSCIRQNQYSPTSSDDPHNGPSTRGFGGGTGSGYPRGPPPPYPSDNTHFPGSADSCGAVPRATRGWAPGFWSGIGAGTGLGYLFGQRNNTGYGGGLFGGSQYSRGPAYNPSYGGGGGTSSSFSSGGSSGTREASGFGGTRRR